MPAKRRAARGQRWKPGSTRPGRYGVFVRCSWIDHPAIADRCPEQSVLIARISPTKPARGRARRRSTGPFLLAPLRMGSRSEAGVIGGAVEVGERHALGTAVVVAEGAGDEVVPR